MRPILVLFVLFIFLNTGLARDVPGYIVSSEGDTLFGEIHIQKTSLISIKIVCKGLDLEVFHSFVKFKESDNLKFESYEPKDIVGFGFFYDSVEYHFETFRIVTKNFINVEKEKLRFLNLIYEGDFSLYRDIVRYPSPFIYGGRKNNTVPSSEYYLFSEELGLTALSVLTNDEIIAAIKEYIGSDNILLEWLLGIVNNQSSK